MPALPCLSSFSLSVVGNYADENENDESCLVSLGPISKQTGSVPPPDSLAEPGGFF